MRSSTTDLQGSESVVDPWSGAGTTTVACLRSGIESWGVDINPVATVIARARLNPRSARQSLLDSARSLVEETQGERPRDDTGDLARTLDGRRRRRRNPSTRTSHTRELGRSCATATRWRRSPHRMPVAFRVFPLHRLLRRRAQPARQLRNRLNPMWIKSPNTGAQPDFAGKTYRARAVPAAGGGLGRQAVPHRRPSRPVCLALQDGNRGRNRLPAALVRRGDHVPAICHPSRLCQGSLPELAVLGANRRVRRAAEVGLHRQPQGQGRASSCEPLQSRSCKRSPSR